MALTLKALSLSMTTATEMGHMTQFLSWLPKGTLKMPKFLGIPIDGGDGKLKELKDVLSWLDLLPEKHTVPDHGKDYWKAGVPDTDELVVSQESSNSPRALQDSTEQVDSEEITNAETPMESNVATREGPIRFPPYPTSDVATTKPQLPSYPGYAKKPLEHKYSKHPGHPIEPKYPLKPQFPVVPKVPFKPNYPGHPIHPKIPLKPEFPVVPKHPLPKLPVAKKLPLGAKKKLSLGMLFAPLKIIIISGALVKAVKVGLTAVVGVKLLKLVVKVLWKLASLKASAVFLLIAAKLLVKGIIAKVLVKAAVAVSVVKVKLAVVLFGVKAKLLAVVAKAKISVVAIVALAIKILLPLLIGAKLTVKLALALVKGAVKLLLTKLIAIGTIGLPALLMKVGAVVTKKIVVIKGIALSPLILAKLKIVFVVKKIMLFMAAMLKALHVFKYKPDLFKDEAPEMSKMFDELHKLLNGDKPVHPKPLPPFEHKKPVDGYYPHHPHHYAAKNQHKKPVDGYQPHHPHHYAAGNMRMLQGFGTSDVLELPSFDAIPITSDDGTAILQLLQEYVPGVPQVMQEFMSFQEMALQHQFTGLSRPNISNLPGVRPLLGVGPLPAENLSAAAAVDAMPDFAGVKDEVLSVVQAAQNQLLSQTANENRESLREKFNFGLLQENALFSFPETRLSGAVNSVSSLLPLQ
eukprot:GHVT01082553.1.p1 GENE.GHVT01082553.1~~GHVT01082553.1.p1  ORF type:complete len:690 (+),score=75.24 GHVT01082553.1:2022-4091(+)